MERVLEGLLVASRLLEQAAIAVLCVGALVGGDVDRHFVCGGDTCLGTGVGRWAERGTAALAGETRGGLEWALEVAVAEVLEVAAGEVIPPSEVPPSEVMGEWRERLEGPPSEVAYPRYRGR